MAFVIVVSMLVIVPGCIGQEEEEVTLSFYSWQIGEGAWFEYWDEDFIPAFEAEHPNIKINLWGVPYADYWDKAVVDFEAGTPPDVLGALVAGGRIYEWAAAGYIDPLDDLLADSDIPANFLEGPMADCTIDGKVYGLPGWARAIIPTYRKDLFEQAGITLPIEGMDAFKDAIVKLAALEGVVPIGEDFTTQGDVFAYLYGPSGKHLVDANGRPQLNDPDILEAMEFINWIVENEYTVMGTDTNTMRQWQCEGSIGIRWDGPWIWGTQMSLCPDEIDNFGYMLSPFPEHRTDGGVGAAWVIPTDAKNKDAAWKFIEFFATPEMQLALADRTGSTGARKGVIGDDWIAAHPHQENFIKQFEEFGYTASVLPGAEIYTSEVWKIFLDHATAYWFGDADLKSEMDDAQAEALEAMGMS